MQVRKVRAKPDSTQKLRRGATLVFVAILMTVVMMFAGFSIDFSRMYTYKAQLKVLADAASLSAVVDKLNGQTESDAKARAIGLKSANLVDNSQAMLVDADIEPGRWDVTAVDSLQFTPSTWTDANAVRATPRYTADWTLARIFGVNT